MPQQPYVDLTLLVLLFFACMYDLAQRRIPNRLLALGLLGALGLHLWLMPPLALLTHLLGGFATCLAMFLPLYLMRAMAAGDVKLMATVGSFSGPALGLEIGLATYCAGGLLALGILLVKGQLRVALGNASAVLRPLLLRLGGTPLALDGLPQASVGGMPYALAITSGTVLMLWIRHT